MLNIKSLLAKYPAIVGDDTWIIGSNNWSTWLSSIVSNSTYIYNNREAALTNYYPLIGIGQAYTTTSTYVSTVLQPWTYFDFRSTSATTTSYVARVAFARLGVTWCSSASTHGGLKYYNSTVAQIPMPSGLFSSIPMVWISCNAWSSRIAATAVPYSSTVIYSYINAGSSAGATGEGQVNLIAVGAASNIYG